jgi:LmbE family N-acetylglucosaminyl deacetylase
MSFFSPRTQVLLLALPFVAACSAVAQYRPAADNAVSPAARVSALPLPEDRGYAAIEESLRRLSTFKSVMAIVAHPDDEDGAMLTYESRVKGAHASLLTLTRGEGGQNAMGSETYDALGLMRTNELLAAGEYYGVRQYWGTEADFGFSKTREEAMEKWGHDRVLYDAVLAVRRERPWVITSTFIGGITDGHGHHQVSGQIAQEVYDAAGDPNIFPEQFKLGLRPWKPFAVYARIPFAPITDKGMFDYATGKWAPAKFYNYVTKQWSEGRPSTDLRIPVGVQDPVLGRSAVQIAREGWGLQLSQYGGGSPALSGEVESEYHLYAARSAEWSSAGTAGDYFPQGWDSWTALTKLAGDGTSRDFAALAATVDSKLSELRAQLKPGIPEKSLPLLTNAYGAALKLREQLANEKLNDDTRADLGAALDSKLAEFQRAIALLNGVELQAFRTAHEKENNSGPPSRSGIDETPRGVQPGERFLVRVHLTASERELHPKRIWLEGGTSGWIIEQLGDKNAPGTDTIFAVTAPANESPTEPFFHRPTIEQPYYDVADPQLRGESFAPYPLTAWAEYEIDGLPVRIGEVVQTLKRVMGTGGVFEPLVVTPAVGLSMEPEAKILPLDGSAMPVTVRVQTSGAATGVVRLKLPAGWSVEPAEAKFESKGTGATEPLHFTVKPAANLPADGEIRIAAEADVNGKPFTQGWEKIGYTGLRPYNLYKDAVLRTRRMDVKLQPGLKIGYVMGTGDHVPEVLEAMGTKVHLLTEAELRSGDLTQWDTILIGIRAYSVRSELAQVEPRLEDYVRSGGNLVVQYQSGDFPAPYKLELGDIQERVTEEDAPVKLIAQNPLLSTPNQITEDDFKGWVEERGHSFMKSWDTHYTALTETADPGQDPQQGGVLVTSVGKGRYIYCAYALYRQLPELVPGAYRILGNLVSYSARPK